MSGQVQYWPLAVGWTLVAVLLLTGFRRQALIAGTGMAVVSYHVVGVGTGWPWIPR